MSPAIALNQVAFGYSGNGPFVFEKLSLTIQHGEFRAIMGMNGSGKTTLAHIMSGVLKPTQGEISYGGVTHNALNNNHLRLRVGLVFQNPDHQWITNSVDEEIAFGLCQMGMKPEIITKRVEEAKARFEIEDLSKRSPHQLSGGEKRRVALASIWVLDPEIWVLDEPLAYLDEAGRHFMKKWLSQLKEEKKTVIYFGHRLDEVIGFDRISILHQSRIVWEGPPKLLLTLNGTEWGVAYSEANRLWLSITETSSKTSAIMTKEELIEALWGLA